MLGIAQAEVGVACFFLPGLYLQQLIIYSKSIILNSLKSGGGTRYCVAASFPLALVTKLF
jgi:hypothetical protein